jgi:hypothetical protein
MTNQQQTGETVSVQSQQVSELTPSEKKAFYRSVHEAAVAAGVAAGQAVELPQYVAVQRANPLDDSSEIVKVYERPFELCGFASVQIKGANKGYGRWVVASDTGKTDSYNGGAAIWVFGFGQSHGRKVAYARAYADSAQAALQAAGEDAFVWVWERLD